MKKSLPILLLSLLLGLMLAACGGSGGSSDIDVSDIGDARNGQALFEEVIIGPKSAPGCSTCHSLEPDVVIVGPSQIDVGLRAETRVDGMTAEEYIRESILEPDAYTVEGFTPGLMYSTYGDELSETEIDDLVAYFLTLRGE